MVDVLHLHPLVDDCEEVEVAGVCPASAEEEEASEDCQEDAKDDVEEVETGVDGQEGAGGGQQVPLLLRTI